MSFTFTLQSQTNTTYSITGLDSYLGLQEALAPRFYKQSVHDGGKVVSPMHWTPLPTPPRRHTWYSILSKAGSTPGPQCSQKDLVRNSQLSYQESQTCDLQACSTCLMQMHHHVPQSRISTSPFWSVASECRISVYPFPATLASH